MDEPKRVNLVRSAVVAIERIVERELPRHEAERVRPGKVEEDVGLAVVLEDEHEAAAGDHVGCDKGDVSEARPERGGDGTNR